VITILIKNICIKYVYIFNIFFIFRVIAFLNRCIIDRIVYVNYEINICFVILFNIFEKLDKNIRHVLQYHLCGKNRYTPIKNYTIIYMSFVYFQSVKFCMIICIFLKIDSKYTNNGINFYTWKFAFY